MRTAHGQSRTRCCLGFDVAFYRPLFVPTKNTQLILPSQKQNNFTGTMPFSTDTLVFQKLHECRKVCRRMWGKTMRHTGLKQQPVFSLAFATHLLPLVVDEYPTPRCSVSRTCSTETVHEQNCSKLGSFAVSSFRAVFATSNRIERNLGVLKRMGRVT